jgi:hypothetical protein
MPCRDVIPIAANKDRAASVTVGGLARRIVSVAGIDVMQARIRCDPSRFAQRLERCRWMIYQLPVQMKGLKLRPLLWFGLPEYRSENISSAPKLSGIGPAVVAHNRRIYGRAVE